MVVWLSVPLVPVTATVYTPAGVEALVETVSTDDPEFVTEVGLEEADAPEGKPLALKTTLPAKPPPEATV
jgi:hypothetical protein